VKERDEYNKALYEISISKVNERKEKMKEGNKFKEHIGDKMNIKKWSNLLNEEFNSKTK